MNGITPEQGGILLHESEKDALGEIGNICMGTCATTLSTLLGKRVVITTPKVTVSRGNEYLQEYEKPVVATEVSYTEGLDGINVFLLKKEDALLITRLLMGEDMSEEDIGGMYLSAMSEVMNQMVGSSSTALADILNVQVNISPPVTTEFSREDQIIETMFAEQVFIRIDFRMEIEDLLVSNIMQIMPVEFGKRLSDSLFDEDTPNAQENMPQPEPQKLPEKNPPVAQMQDRRQKKNDEKKAVDLKAARFQSFDQYKEDTAEKLPQQNIDLIIDVPLQVTVVLGKSRKSIREILKMGMGSVIVLDRLAGEMVDILVNGKIFAHGEVVVIDDNYGVRITEMVPGQINI
jgi:flagellar motor switch protein FliN/FliY